MRSNSRIFVGVGVFAFLVFGDSALSRGQARPPTVLVLCEPQKNLGEMCFGAVNPNEPLSSRIPVILIHGLEPKYIPGPPNVAVWLRLVSYLQQLKWFNQKYKLYYVSYYSNIQNIRGMGLIFIDLLDRMDLADPTFRGKPLVIIGHSMGGLIARSFMQEPRFGSAGPGGDRVLRLITLGTPHHGTPFANGPARDDKAGLFVRFLFRWIDGGLFNDFLTWSIDNRFDLHWDNYDNLLDYGRYPENNYWLEWLNSRNIYGGKIVAYGGEVTPLSNISDCFGFSWECLAAIMMHGLGIGENDGVVPYDSALFYPCRGCAMPHWFLHYSHDEIVSGKSDDDPLFQYIAGDLLGAEILPEPGFDSYADLGNPADERFHNLRGWDNINLDLLPYAENDRTSRYQNLRSSNSVDLFVPQPGMPYQLSFRSEDGLCDDSFSVFVNGRGPVYVYSRFPLSIFFPFHSIRIGAELVPSSRVTVSFYNQAGDNCGRAAIYFVRLDPLDSALNVATPIIKSISASPSGIGLENATRFTFSLDTNASPPQTAFFWDFGDDRIATGGTTTTHVFTRSGSFTVRATATNGAGRATASMTVRVASLVGTWFATVTGHIPYSGVPITWVELRLNQPLSVRCPWPCPSLPLSASWIDSAGCRAGPGTKSPYLYGSVDHPRFVTVGVEHLFCNYDSDFYLGGTADEEIRVITGACTGGPNCRFTMTRR